MAWMVVGGWVAQRVSRVRWPFFYRTPPAFSVTCSYFVPLVFVVLVPVAAGVGGYQARVPGQPDRLAEEVRPGGGGRGKFNPFIAQLTFLGIWLTVPLGGP